MESQNPLIQSSYREGSYGNKVNLPREVQQAPKPGIFDYLAVSRPSERKKIPTLPNTDQGEECDFMLREDLLEKEFHITSVNGSSNMF